MRKISVILVYLCVSLVNWTDALAAAARPKVVIAHAAMNFRVAPLWVAQDQGFFSKYGIDSEIIYMRGGPTLMSGMLSGDIQIGWTASSILAPIAEGADFVVVAGFNNRVTDELIVRPGIKRPEDLRGKRFGVQSIGGGGWMGAMLGLESLGLEPKRDDIRVLVVGDNTFRSQALEAGSIDATVLDGAFSRKAKSKGMISLADFSQANLPMMNHLVAVRRTYLQRQPEIVENVLRALVEGLAFTWSAKSKSAVLKSVMRRLRITEMNIAEDGYQELLTRGGLEKRPHPSLEGVRNVQRLMTTSNPRVGEVKLEEIIDRSIMRKLDDSGFIDRMYGVYSAK
ncbi:MAG: ABC transporter substrate-binding protein [Deltaproteobacteria bacterium]|nr:ABC transporter substrate-binding protein [Deltaproteobacteria bacterium]